MEAKPEHWIRLERNPSGKNTGYHEIDLSQIRFVTVDRAHSHQQTLVQLCYGVPTMVSQMNYKGKEAEKFLEIWNEYKSLAWVDEQAEPGLILSGANAPDNFASQYKP